MMQAVSMLMTTRFQENHGRAENPDIRISVVSIMSFFLSKKIRNKGVLIDYSHCGCNLASDTSAPDVIPMTFEPGAFCAAWESGSREDEYVNIIATMA